MQFQKVSVLTRFKPVKGKKEELIEYLVDTANTLSANETGTEICVVSTTPIDDSAVYLYEVYAGQPDKDKHESTKAYGVALKKTQDLIEVAPEIIPLIPQGGKGA